MSAPTDLYDMAAEVLAACVAALDTLTAVDGLEGAPARRYVAPGLPAFDCCDELTVRVALIGQGGVPGVTAGREHSIGRQNLATLIATVTRCTPTGSGTGKSYKPPTEAALEANARQVLADGWVLWNHLSQQIASDTLLGGRCSVAHWDGGRPLDPQGGCAGWIFQLRPEIDGYTETAP